MEIITIVVKKQHVYQKAHAHFDNSPNQVRLPFTESLSPPDTDTGVKILIQTNRLNRLNEFLQGNQGSLNLINNLYPESSSTEITLFKTGTFPIDNYEHVPA